MKAKHIIIKNSIGIILLLFVKQYNPCFAQDTICTTGLMGEIIKNTDGTFYYSSCLQLDNRSGYITTLSYGRWRQVDDSTFAFISSINTKHEILKSYELNDSVNDTTDLTVDVCNENGDLLCKKKSSHIHYYSESSILGVSVYDTFIHIYGASPFGQWHLYCEKKEKSYNHHVIYIRDAFYYNLEYLHFFLVREMTGKWRLIRKLE